MRRLSLGLLFAVVLGLGPATAQSPASGTIERLDPALDDILDRNAKLIPLKQDFFGANEGPVWVRQGGYLPWGWAGLGFAGYYGGYYDPGYGYPAYSSSSGEAGLKLKVKPENASVYVDGYFAGNVDEFDGVFQKLHIEPGPHRIEISADGYDTLTFEIRAEPDRTTTYKGELNRVPAVDSATPTSSADR